MRLLPKRQTSAAWCAAATGTKQYDQTEGLFFQKGTSFLFRDEVDWDVDFSVGRIAVLEFLSIDELGGKVDRHFAHFARHLLDGCAHLARFDCLQGDFICVEPDDEYIFDSAFA